MNVNNTNVSNPNGSNPNGSNPNVHDADDGAVAAGVTRRRFLAGSAAIVAAPRRVAVRSAASPATTAPTAATTTATTTPTTATRASTPQRIPTTPGILVLVTLYGGNDGLNTLIPLDAGPYLSGRGALAYAAAETLQLDAAHGLHPSLRGLKSLWDRKQLAIVRGVGYPNPSRSHFRSQDIWQSASPEGYVATGWLGRWYDATGNDPLGMVGVASSVPRSMVGPSSSAVVVPVGSVRSSLRADVVAGTQTMSRADDALGALAARVRSDANDLGRVDTVFGPMLASQATTNVTTASLEPGATARAANELDLQLNVVARLIKAGAPTRAYAVSLGGFDTHANEKANHARQLTVLDQALTGFVNVMAQDPAGRNVTVLVTSEFGRRVAANGTGGTDHGTAAPVFVAGPSVRGGFYGEDPSLTDLDQGDLKFTTDFRSVYSTVLADVLGADPKTFLGGSFSSLGFVGP